LGFVTNPLDTTGNTDNTGNSNGNDISNGITATFGTSGQLSPSSMITSADSARGLRSMGAGMGIGGRKGSVLESEIEADEMEEMVGVRIDRSYSVHSGRD
jgi:hypothetical protein